MPITLSVLSNGGAVRGRVQKFANEAKQRRLQEKALQQASLAVISSLQAGFQKTKDPDGKKWAELNISVYTHRPLANGIIVPPKRPTTTDSKPLTNTGHMKSTLTHVIVDKRFAVIGYGVKEMAEIAEKHHFGLPGVMRIQINGNITEREVTPHPRKNIGFAKWARLGNKTDKEIIMEIFQEVFRGAF